MTPTTVQHVMFHGTTTELPVSRGKRSQDPDPIWESIAHRAREAAGAWVIVELPGRKRNSLRQSVKKIITGQYKSFQAEAWDAHIDDDNLIYVRHLGTEKVEPINRKAA
jgi:hypothetical protein